MKKFLVLISFALTAATGAMNSASASYYYAWYSDGSCGEVTPNGTLVQWVNKYFCESTLGFRYAWFSDGSCGEVTPSGVLVQWVNRYYCEMQGRS